MPPRSTALLSLYWWAAVITYVSTQQCCAPANPTENSSQQYFDASNTSVISLTHYSLFGSWCVPISCALMNGDRTDEGQGLRQGWGSWSNQLRHGLVCRLADHSPYDWWELSERCRIPYTWCHMTRTINTSIQSFGGRSSVERRYTVGSLIAATATAEVQHYVRRRRSSSIGGAAWSVPLSLVSSWLLLPASLRTQCPSSVMRSWCLERRAGQLLRHSLLPRVLSFRAWLTSNKQGWAGFTCSLRSSPVVLLWSYLVLPRFTLSL